MDERIDNRQLIVDYLQAGCKGRDLGLVGVEIEQFLMDEDGERVLYREKHDRLDTATILEKLSEFYPNVQRSAEGDIMGCSRAAASITIEPACQLELSISPLASIAAVEAEYKNFAFRVGQILKPADYSLEPYGYDPHGKAADCQIIPKPRYRYMDAYFAQLPGMHAERMMRGSASLQVSIDFADERDAVRKMRIATLLGPVFSFLTDNVPVFEGEPNVQPMRRMQIWRQVDPARCGVVPGLFDEGFGFAAYVDWLLATPPIFDARQQEHATGSAPASEVYADAAMTQDDVEHVLGMVWPDVRLKRYIEIRQGDSLPLAPALGYVALLKGLFYSDTNLEIMEHALGVGPDGSWKYGAADVEASIAAIAADNWDARMYGRTVAEWVDLLFQLAPDGLGTEVSYLEGLKDYKGL